MYDENGMAIVTAPHPKMILRLPVEDELPAWSIIRRKAGL
jgi:hypothetical protein